MEFVNYRMELKLETRNSVLGQVISIYEGMAVMFYHCRYNIVYLDLLNLSLTLDLKLSSTIALISQIIFSQNENKKG